MREVSSVKVPSYVRWSDTSTGAREVRALSDREELSGEEGKERVSLLKDVCARME